MRMRGVALGLLVALTIAGCSSDPDENPRPKTENAVRSIDVRKAVPLKVGTDLKVLAELPRRHGKRDVYYTGFTDDGKILGSMAEPEPPSNKIPSPTTTQGYPFIYDLDTEKFTILDEADRPEVSGAGELVSSGDTIAWMEGQGNAIDTSEFTVRSFDRTTGAVRDLAMFDDPEGQIVYGNDLIVRKGVAYFSTPDYSSRKTGTPAVYSVPVDGSEPAKVLAEGMGIELQGDTLTYSDGETRYARDLATGATSKAWTSPHAHEPGFCRATRTETFEAWCIGTPIGDPGPDQSIDLPVLTIKGQSGRTAVLKGFPSDDNFPLPQDIEAYGPWISMVVSGGDWPAPQFLFDLESGTLRQLPTDHMLRPVSPDGTRAILNEVTSEGRAPQRVVEIPKP